MITKGHSKRQEHEHAARHESDFRVTARRNKLLAFWAAELLGVSGDRRDAYAKEVIAADLEMPGDEDLIRKVLGDFEKANVALSRDDLLKKIDTFTAEARSQLQAG
jgi:Uncharacterized conserved protein